ncbi:MAG: alpha/beta fold hydrolase [Dermatophilaceae bacterium]
MRRALVWWVAAGMLLVAGVTVLAGSTADVRRTSTVAGSTPVRLLTPQQSLPGPVIVLVHGFSGSSAMMDPMASALSRAGFVVVTPDLPGHGSNATPLTEGALDSAVADAVGLANELADGGPVALVGHSMGAGAVTDRAAENPAVATVAISLPDAAGLPRNPARPANLLLLWGSAEQRRFVDAALTGLRRGYPQGEPGTTYGVKEAGDARRAMQIAGAEHISVVYRQQTFEEVAAWLSSGSGRPSPRGDARLIGVFLVLAGGVVAARPILARSAGDSSEADVTAPDREGGRAGGGAPWRLLILCGAAVGAAFGAATLQGVMERVPVAVAGYLAGWFAVGALLLWAASRRNGSGIGDVHGLRWGTLAGIVLSLVMALPARLSWAAYELPGVRWWVFLPLLALVGVWFWAEWRVIEGFRGWRRAFLLVASRLIIVIVLLASVALLGAPSFLSLTVPLLVPILLLLAVLAGWARDPLAAAASQAIPTALVVAATFPIVG